MSNPADEFERFCSARLDNLVAADQPPVLISQLPRSGGTLLMRLFDGHPECHAFPHEYGGEVGEILDHEASPEETWEKLHVKKLQIFFENGYKIAQRGNREKGSKRSFPLLVAPALQKRIFMQCYPESFDERAAFAAYFQSYFNAWIDNQNLYTAEPKRWVVFFEPRAVFSRRVNWRFIDSYTSRFPDGRIISVVREPQSWYASASEWSPLEWPSVVPAIDAWVTSVEELLKIKDEHPDRMAVVLFDDLVKDSPGAMRALTEWLGIGNAPETLTPTFNGRPVIPNTSFRIDRTGVVKDPLKRGEKLGAGERAQIDRLAGDLMGQVSEIAISMQSD